MKERRTQDKKVKGIRRKEKSKHLLTICYEVRHDDTNKLLQTQENPKAYKDSIKSIVAKESSLKIYSFNLHNLQRAPIDNR